MQPKLCSGGINNRVSTSALGLKITEKIRALVFFSQKKQTPTKYIQVVGFPSVFAVWVRLESQLFIAHHFYSPKRCCWNWLPHLSGSSWREGKKTNTPRHLHDHREHCLDRVQELGYVQALAYPADDTAIEFQILSQSFPPALNHSLDIWIQVNEHTRWNPNRMWPRRCSPSISCCVIWVETRRAVNVKQVRSCCGTFMDRIFISTGKVEQKHLLDIMCLVMCVYIRSCA